MENKILEQLSEYIYSQGLNVVIPHATFKEQFEIEYPDFYDCIDQDDFIQQFESMNFRYMSMIESLRNYLLETFKVYLKNVRGDGYVLLKPTDQAVYGYEFTINHVKKAIKQGTLILENMDIGCLNPTERLKYSNNLAKLSHFKQMIKSI